MDPCLHSMLREGLANASAVARSLRPRVESLVGAPVGEEAVLAALKRMRGSGEGGTGQQIARVLAASRLDLKTGLGKMVIRRSQQAADAVGELAARHRRIFLQVLQGISSYTIVYESRIRDEVARAVPPGSAIDESSGLAALTVVSPPEISNTPGVVSAILQRLASRGVNVEEVVSCHTDTIVIVRSEEGGRAFDAVQELISECRSLTGA
ncbi:ACT domain-containing protein [Conexivisphaera calida]|nr:ACT domain-containing protein [Conexivisphaera calida]